MNGSPFEDNTRSFLFLLYYCHEQDKEAFYDELCRVVNTVPTSDKLLILSDFNARVGSDYKTYESVVGKFGKGGVNSNGALLLSFCAQRDLCITNTYFNQPNHHYFSWMHPRSKHFHLLEYIIVRKQQLRRCLSPGL